MGAGAPFPRQCHVMLQPRARDSSAQASTVDSTLSLEKGIAKSRLFSLRLCLADAAAVLCSASGFFFRVSLCPQRNKALGR